MQKRDNPQVFHRYLWFFALGTLVVIIVMISFNRLVDPYGFFQSPRLEGFNTKKPEFSLHLRMAKAAAIRQFRPTAIVLGTSRAEYGIDPAHPGWNSSQIYNLALGGSNLYEAYRYLQHAHAVNALKRVVLMLDFSMFNAVRNPEKIDFEESRLAVDVNGNPQSNILIDQITSLASIDAFFASIATILRQHSNSEDIYQANGMRESIHIGKYIEKMGGHHVAFAETEKGYYRDNYDSFSFIHSKWNNLEIFRNIIRFGYQNEIDLYIVIPPSHARDSEVIATKGIWLLFEQWKKLLVSIDNEEAIRERKPLKPIWDFSGYNSLTIEALPPIGDREHKMSWYWESSHYKKELGDLILDRIFNYHSSDRYLPEDFGVQLTPENIESHLSRIRADREKWRNIFPEDVAEIEALKSIAQ